MSKPGQNQRALPSWPFAGELKASKLHLRTTPLHERTSQLCLQQNWRRWAGYLVAGSYELTLDREYWAIRNAAARIDDGTISRLDETTFRMTSADPSLRWLVMNAVGLEVEITEVTNSLAALSFQGPNTRAVPNRCCASTVDGLKYFRLMQNQLTGITVTICRTGYTGDLGYEIWMDAKDALQIWDMLMDTGHHYGIVPVGILAMDMARVEAGLFMIEVDYLSASHAWIEAQKSSPFEVGLGWAVSLDKQG